MIEKFLQIEGLSPTDVEPLSLQFYLSYAQWFQEQKQIDAVPVLVERLDCADSEDGRFLARPWRTVGPSAPSTW